MNGRRTFHLTEEQPLEYFNNTPPLSHRFAFFFVKPVGPSSIHALVVPLFEEKKSKEIYAMGSIRGSLVYELNYVIYYAEGLWSYQNKNNE